MKKFALAALPSSFRRPPIDLMGKGIRGGAPCAPSAHNIFFFEALMRLCTEAEDVSAVVSAI